MLPSILILNYALQGPLFLTVVLSMTMSISNAGNEGDLRLLFCTLQAFVVRLEEGLPLRLNARLGGLSAREERSYRLLDSVFE